MFYSIFKRRGIKSKIIIIIVIIIFFLFLHILYDRQNDRPEKTSYQILKKTQNSPSQDLEVNYFLKKNKTLREKIDQLNSEHLINNFHFIRHLLNNEEFESKKFINQTKTNYPNPNPKLLVILVQVHSRLDYLKELINSLRETRYINETLLVFSHDFIDVVIENLIKSIDFCAVSFFFR